MDYPEKRSEGDEEDDNDVDYAVVSDSGVMRPEPRTDENGDEVPEEERPERHESPLLAERGIKLQVSRRSYLFTYVLAILVATFAFLALQKFSIAYYWAPEGPLQLGSDAVYLAFVLAIASFAGEADFERGMRHYLITNSEVVKVEGILRKNRVIIPYQSVSNVTVHKGILGRLLDFGDINVIGFDAEIDMRGVGEPDTFYRIINNKISRMRGTRPLMPAPTRIEEDIEEQPIMDWRREQRSIGTRLGQPESRPSLFSSLKSRVQSAPEAKLALKPRRKAAARKAKKR